jgi:hypothetical protein
MNRGQATVPPRLAFTVARATKQTQPSGPNSRSGGADVFAGYGGRTGHPRPRKRPLAQFLDQNPHLLAKVTASVLFGGILKPGARREADSQAKLVVRA